MLLIVTPDNNLTGHFGIFIIFVVAAYLVVSANFVEVIGTKRAHKKSLIWIAWFTLNTLMLVGFGTIDFNGYNYTQCPNANATAIKAMNNGVNRSLCEQGGVVPWQIMAFSDYMWFITLGTTVFFLPDAPPIKISVKLAELDSEKEPLDFAADKFANADTTTTVVLSAGAGDTDLDARQVRKGV